MSNSASARSFTELFRQLSPPIKEQRYLLGVRGLLVIEAFVWVFLQTFVPAAVKDSNNTTGPFYQTILRKSLSVLFWNESLIYSAFILLSARTICVPFLNISTKTSVASASFRRGIRLWFPVAVALAIVKVTFSKIGLDYVDRFKTITGNSSFETPYLLSSFTIYFNSVFNLFFTTFNFSSQSGSLAFPAQTLWVVNVIYAQSYTVYMTMVIIPYTRNRWRVEAAIIFILTAWWVQSWAWYTITGLTLADAVMNMDFKARARHGVPIWRTRLRCPLWIICVFFMASGLTIEYLWVAWRPQSSNIELKGHTGLYYTGGLNTNYNLIQPQARDDNYLVLLGFFLLLESSDFIQWLFDNRFFVYLGSRSLSESQSSLCGVSFELICHFSGYFLIQSTIIYTIGIKLFLFLHIDKYNLSSQLATGLCLLVCLGVSIPCAEIFHSFVDYPSKLIAHVIFNWIRK